jgi:tRNA threonylcarbamoyladenosine biosynthesis protein TsaE
MMLRQPRPVLTRTASADATRALASEVAGVARAGDIIVLAGDLGTGKTVWVQGFARGMGVDEQVTSPTFTLVRPYRGRALTLLHADLYRLDRLSEMADLDLIDQLDGRAVACIEWGDLATPVLPADLLEVRLDFGQEDDERTLAFQPVGSGWARRSEELTRAVSPWLASG